MGEAATVSIAALLIFIARFLYVPFLGDWDRRYEEGIFGFTWLSTFLSRIGNEIAWFALGLVLLYGTIFMEHRARKHFKNLSYLILITAAYFISWAFYDGNNFHRYTEMFFAAATSIMGFVIARKLFRFIHSYILRLKSVIADMIDDMVNRTPSHVKDIEVFEEEVMWPRLKSISDEI